jgi:hypothetical protein
LLRLKLLLCLWGHQPYLGQPVDLFQQERHVQLERLLLVGRWLDHDLQMAVRLIPLLLVDLLLP